MTNPARCGTSPREISRRYRGGRMIRSYTKPDSTTAAAPAVAPPNRHAPTTAATSSTTDVDSPTSMTRNTMAGSSGTSAPAAIRHRPTARLRTPCVPPAASPWCPSAVGDCLPAGVLDRQHPVEPGHREQVADPRHRVAQQQGTVDRGQPLVDAHQRGEAGRVAERDAGQVEGHPRAGPDVPRRRVAQLLGRTDVQLADSGQHDGGTVEAGLADRPLRPGGH